MSVRKIEIWKYVFALIAVCGIIQGVFLIGYQVNINNDRVSKLCINKQMDYLKADGKAIVDENGNEVMLRGVNAGGWLFQELWMTPTCTTEQVRAQSDIVRILTDRFGTKKADLLLDIYTYNYWKAADFKRCKELGINCIRLPFWYRNLVDENGNFYGYNANAKDPYKKAFQNLDWFVEEAAENGIYVILDFHGAPGSQNGSDHSGVDGGNTKEAASSFFFGEQALKNQELYYEIWEVIAKRYKDNSAIAGYDLLNEAYSSYRYHSSYSDEQLHTRLWDVYNQAYQRIRNIDTKHIVIMEGIWRPSDLPDPSVYGWQNVMYEYHMYQFDDAENASGGQTRALQEMVDAITKADYQVPSYLGEFTLQQNIDTWEQGLELLETRKINWTLWTYKTIGYYGNWGLVHHVDDIGEVNVETDSYTQIAKVWGRTDKCVENKELMAIIRKVCQNQ